MKNKIFSSEIRVWAEPGLQETLKDAARQRHTSLSELVRGMLRDGLRRLTDRDGQPPTGPDLLAAV